MPQPAFCNVVAQSRGVPGKNVVLTVFPLDGENPLVVDGQKALTVNRDANTSEVTAKDTKGWVETVIGLKSWSIDTDLMFITDSSNQKILRRAFRDSTPLCVKVIDRTNPDAPVDLVGGVAFVTSYPIDAPEDDVTSSSISLTGTGELVDLTISDADGSDLPTSSEPVAA